MKALLKDKVILVTGSTTGIGESVARRVVEEGGSVMIHGRSETRAQEIVEELGSAAAYTLGDLLDPDTASELVDATVDRFGRLDGLVNNAALLTRSNIENADAQLFDRQIAVNVRAPLLLTQAAVKQFRSQGEGVVVNVGSINALGGEQNLLVYSMTKGAMTTMTRNLASYLVHDGIRINQINVGWTLTDNEKQVKIDDGLEDGWWNNIPEQFAPAGRIFDPEEVAAHVVFWLSDAAGPVNGSVFEIEQLPFVGRNPTK